MKIFFTKAFCLLVFFTANTAHAQQSKILGKVTTSDGKPAANVNITIKESRETIISGEDGTFTLNAGKEGISSIIVSYIGLTTQEKKVAIRNGENTEVNFQLKENAGQLDEVIVTSHKSLNA